MFIELFRAWTPTDVHEDECGACGHTIAPRSVIAELATDDRYDMGVACEECVRYLGARSPERSPTIEVYEEALSNYPEPMYESQEALEVAAKRACTTLWRSPTMRRGYGGRRSAQPRRECRPGRGPDPGLFFGLEPVARPEFPLRSVLGNRGSGAWHSRR